MSYDFYERVPTYLEVPGSIYMVSTMSASSRSSSMASGINIAGLSGRRHDRRKERLNTELLVAVFRGRIQEVTRLLDNGASPEATCRPTGLSACHIAAFKGFSEILKILLTAGAPCDRRSKKGAQPAHLAAWSGQVQCLQVLGNTRKDVLDCPVLTCALSPAIDTEISDSWSHRHEDLLPMDLALPEGRTPLHVACSRLHIECFKLLMALGVSIEPKDNAGLTPLWLTGSCRNSEPLVDGISQDTAMRLIVKQLMQKGAKLPKTNTVVREGNLESQLRLKVTPLHTAVKYCDIELIQFLLKSGAPMTAWDEEGLTPLHLAVFDELLEPLTVMLRWQTPCKVVDVKDSAGCTPLHLAVLRQWKVGVSLLLEVGADVKAVTQASDTVLHLAAEVGNALMLNELLSVPDSSKITDLRNRNYHTPLSLAVSKNHLSCTELLCARGADVTCTLPGDFTLLHMAALNNSPEILEYLILSDKSLGSLKDTRCQDTKGGRTPLHIAAASGYRKCVEILLQAGCDALAPTTAEENLSTPLHLAAKNGHYDTVEAILRYDRDKETLKATDSDKRQPLHIAALNSHAKCVQVMLKYGANIATTISDKNGSRSALEIITYCVPQPITFLEEIFDTYIDANGYPINDPMCEISVKYDILTPRGEGHKQMSVLTTLLNSGRQKLQDALLLHPLVESFLYLKWEKLKVFFWLIMGLYMALTMSITGLTYFHYVLKDKPTPYVKFGVICSRCVLFSSLYPALLIELINFSQLQRYYFLDFECWVKWLVFVGTCTLGIAEPIKWWARYLAAITILLAWTELLFLMGKSPTWGYYVLMFYKVAKNVFKVLASFTFLLLGFTFAFIISFEGKAPFTSLWVSFVRVICMMVELNFPDTLTGHDPTPFSIVGRGLFIVFVLVVAIVLTNLLVGMAVSDITLLETQGRTQRLAKQIGFFNLLELFVYSRVIMWCFPGNLKRAVMQSRAVPLSVVIRPGSTEKNLYHDLPRFIRDPILDKVGARQTLMDRQMSTSLDHLENRISSLENKLDNKQNHRMSEASLLHNPILQEILTKIRDIQGEIESLHSSMLDLKSK